MTVGIGLICEGGKAAVVSADRLITQENPRTEFDSVPKVSLLSDRAVISITGGYSEVADILAGVTNEDRRSEYTRDLAECILRERNRVRRRYMNAITQRHFGVDFEKYIVMELPAMQSQQLILTQRQISEGLSLAFLLAGIDTDGKARLIVIDDSPSSPLNADAAGFTTIGAGYAHANSALIRLKYEVDWSVEEAVFAAYSAKRASEHVVGVGPATDIAIVIPGAPSRLLEKPALKALRRLYRKRINRFRLRKSECSELARIID